MAGTIEAMGARQIELPITVDAPPRRIDALTAHAVRLALWPTTAGDAATELLAAAHGNPLVLAGVLARVHRSNATEPSAVGARAEASVRAAYELAKER